MPPNLTPAAPRGWPSRPPARRGAAQAAASPLSANWRGTGAAGARAARHGSARQVWGAGGEIFPEGAAAPAKRVSVWVPGGCSRQGAEGVAGGGHSLTEPPFPRPPAWEMLLYSRVLPLPHPHGQISPAHLGQTAHRHMWASLCNPLLWRNRQQHVELLVVKCQSPLLGHSLLVPFYFSCLMMQSAELGPNFLSIR